MGRAPWAERAASRSALGGFVVAHGVVLVGACSWREALFGWVDVVVLGVTLFVTHLGLLFWELRSVSFSLAAPGLGVIA